MAVITNGILIVGGTTITGLKQMNLTYEAETQDDTVMGHSARSNVGSLKNWQLEAELVLAEAAGSVATLFPLVGSTTTVQVREVNAATSTTNPAYTGTALLQSFPPFGQAVGDLRLGTVTFVPAEGSDLTRATA